MAYRQVDPARLQGDALRRWYLRSPEEIERERAAAAEEEHRRFFSTPLASDDAPTPNPPVADDGQNSTLIWEPVEQNKWTGVRSRAGTPGRHPPSARHSGSFAVAAGRTATAAGQGAAPPACIACHQPPVPAPLPWPIGTFPFPQGSMPSLRDAIPNLGAPKDRKQCEIQDRSDRQICGRRRSDEVKAICNESAVKRWKHCLRTGEIGDPALDTTKRLNGSPPIRRPRR